MADENRQREVYIFVLSLQSNRQNFNSIRLVLTLLNFLAAVDILHDFRSYLASLCLGSFSFLLAFRQHIADGKILTISVKVMEIGVEQSF